MFHIVPRRISAQSPRVGRHARARLDAPRVHERDPDAPPPFFLAADVSTFRDGRRRRRETQTARRDARARSSRETRCRSSCFRAVTSGSRARIRFHDAAFVGPQSETRLYWSVGKRGLTILVSVRRRLETARRLSFRFFVFFPLGPGKLKRASTRRNRAAAFAVTTTLEAVC